MIDSKDCLCILEIMDLVEIVMCKTPSIFICCFIREGVVENLEGIALLNSKSLSMGSEGLMSIIESRSALKQRYEDFVSTLEKKKNAGNSLIKIFSKQLDELNNSENDQTNLLLIDIETNPN
jgi:hypothetical protein